MQTNLSTLSTESAREDAFLTSLSLAASENTEYYKNLIRKIQLRTKAVLDYVPTYNQIHSKIILLKPTEQSVQGETEDYGLSEVASDVTVRCITGDHITILKSDELSNVIAKELL